MTDTTPPPHTIAAPTLERPGQWPRTGLLVGLIGLILTATLGWMTWDRISLLKNGREIVLAVTPVDPRSLFRGDYVILGYAITQVPAPSGQSAPARNGTPVYVTLEQQADGGWKAVASSLTHPGAVVAGAAVAAPNRIVLRGRSEHEFWRSASTPPTTPQVRVRYGIESYFVPEGKGMDLENAVRDKKIAARIAVDAKGRAAIKGLLVDGKPVHDEPLL